MRITGAESADLFAGTPQQRLQVVYVKVLNDAAAVGEPTVRMHGIGERNPGPLLIQEMNPGELRGPVSRPAYT
jgi:hypothetical protein